MAGRCELCSGKIVGGRCVDCGMDYTRMKNRYRLNENCSDYDLNANQTNRNFEKSLQGKEEQRKSAPQKEKINLNGKTTVKRPPKKKKTAGAENGKRWGSIIFLIFLIILMARAVIDEMMDDYTPSYMMSDTDEADIWDEDTDENLPVIPDEGESLDFDLSQQGWYLIGTDIPEGTYVFTNLDDKNEAYLRVEDEENGISDSYFVKPGEYEEDIDLYDGALLMVGSGTVVNCMTDNAQVEDMKAYDYEVGEECILPSEEETETEYVAGVDFSAGRYMLRYKGEGTSVVSVGVYSELCGGMTFVSLSCEKYSDGENIYTGVILEDGDSLVVKRYGEDEAEVELIPLTEAIGYAGER